MQLTHRRQDNLRNLELSAVSSANLRRGGYLLHVFRRLEAPVQKPRTVKARSLTVRGCRWKPARCELLESFHPECYSRRCANARTSPFVQAQAAILRFHITSGVSWRKELFCIPCSPAQDQHHTHWWGGE